MASRNQNPVPAAPPAEYPDVDPMQRHRAARAVASAATDADDCADLLDALGLCAAEGVEVPAQRDGRR